MSLSKNPPKKPLDISVVLPVYNEAESIQEAYHGIVQQLNGQYLYEVLFVDDGSTDATWHNIQHLHVHEQHCSGVSLRTNRGKSIALAAGFNQAQGNIIITMDGDLQDNPADIIRLVNKIRKGYDVVAGRKQWKASALRKILTRLFNATVSLTTGIHIHDFNCSIKAYRREVLDEINVYGELHRFLPVLAHWRGFRITEIPVDNFKRKYGKSKYGLERIWRGFFDLASILFIVKYSKKPLHFFGLWGLLLFFGGIIIDAYLAILHFAGQAIGDRPLLMLGTLMIILGIQFFSLGLLGESLNYHLHKRQETPIRKVLTHR